MSFSHKKMKEIKNKIDEVVIDGKNTEEQRELLYDFLKNILKYDESCGSYNKEKYEKHDKVYLEKNKEKLNKYRAENKKINYHKKKLLNQNLETT
jgi:hypothetical protein